MSTNTTADYDYTVNGHCSKCGRCCTAILPVSQSEIYKIKDFVTQNNIKVYNRNNLMSTKFENVCPFLSLENKCILLTENKSGEDIRPAICESFLCKNHKTANFVFSHVDKHIVNMLELFSGIKTKYYPDVSVLDKEYQNKKNKVLK